MASSVTVDNHVFQEHLFEKVASKVRQMVQWFLNRVMQEEQMLFLGCMDYERTTVRRGYRNGYDNRRLDTQWGTLRLRVPKVRNTPEPFRTRVFDRYRRRQGQLDKLVEQWMAFGMSTRKAGHALHNAFDCLVSPETVSRIMAELDEEIAAFHRRPFEKGYRYLFLDAKHGCIKRSGLRSRRGRKRRAVLLLAWGVDHRGKEELVDFRVAPGGRGQLDGVPDGPGIPRPPGGEPLGREAGDDHKRRRRRNRSGARDGLPDGAQTAVHLPQAAEHRQAPARPETPQGDTCRRGEDIQGSDDGATGTRPASPVGQAVV